MAFTTTLPFDGSLSQNVNDELWVGAAFDAPAGSYLEIVGSEDIPYSAEGLPLHPDHDFIFESGSCIGLRGDFTIEYSWLEDQTVTQQMLDTFVSVVNNSNSSSVVFENTQADFAGRTATFSLSVPPAPELGWRGSPLDWGILLDRQKIIWDSSGYYLCYLVLDTDWRSWESEAIDIAPNSSLDIDRLEGASSVYLVFSEDVTTSTGATLSRGVAYAQTTETLEVTAGSEDTLAIRMSK